jgi:8-oxo-dGTP pyrophosphatase MutT (NUDIX family)
MLVRDRPTAGIEVYLARRNAHSAFMPDAYVFPGGALDDADRAPEALALLEGSPGGVAPAYAVAALRELFEEAGVLLALQTDLRALDARDVARLAGLRAKLSEGDSFVGSLQALGWRLDGAHLAYYSRWITPPNEPRRFDACFFVARAPENQHALVDAVELHDGAWLTPQVALARNAQDEFMLAFPTRLHLERLSAFTRVADLDRAARARSPIAVMPTLDAAGTISLPPELAAW